jgi:glycosyltransferase involved in cell wall biosynthesis
VASLDDTREPGAVSVRISVIIPVRSDPQLEACLGSLARQTLEGAAYELIVVDGAHDDATSRLAAATGARHVVQSGGAYASRNAGAELARGGVLAFTDSDVIVPPDWLADIDALFRDEACQAVTGPSSSLSDTPLARWIQAVDDGRWERLRGTNDHAVIDTRNFAIRREILERVPFDASFRQAGDLDLGLRLHQSGVQVRIVEGLRVAHHHPDSLRALVAREIRRGRGLARLDHKHGIARPSQGERPLRVAGIDLKARLLRLARRPGWRVIPAAAAGLAIAALLPVTWVLARLPGADRLGQRTFIALERAALLYGRATAPVSGG